MTRRFIVGAATVALALTGVAPGLAATRSSDAPQMAATTTGVVRTLLDTVPNLVREATDIGPLRALTTLHVALPLALPRRAALDRLVSAEYDAKSRSFHRFVSPSSFARQFGAPSTEIDRVTAVLKTLGLHVAAPAANHLYVEATAPVALLEQVFGAELDRFRIGARSFFANTSDLKLPAALDGLVTGVLGLDNTNRPQAQVSAGHPSPAAAVTRQIGPIGSDGGVTPCPAAIAGVGYTAPQLAAAYGFNGLYAKGFLGQGMSAALVEFDDFHDSNVAAVKSCYHVHPDVTRRLVDGGTGGPPAGGEIEAMADITTMLEMLPQLAHLYVYVAPITSLGEVELYNRFVTDDDAPVMSSSWGSCEELASAADNRLFAEITEEAAAQGQQIFDASGDAGAVDCSSLFPSPTGDSISVEQEAAVPWVTGVGGTDLGLRTANGLPGPRDEATWNDAGAAGGGVSTQWRMPTWQHALASARTAAGHSRAACGAPKGALCREVPDISADADPDFGMQGQGLQFTDDIGSPGYSIFCDTPNCSLLGGVLGLPIPLPPLGGLAGWQPIGGTSLSTPLTAAAAVLWDQEAKAAHLDGLGLINPALYRVAADPVAYARDFHDVTTGSNDAQYDPADCPAGCNPHHLYAAGKGYDMATGLGSYDATNLGDDLIKQAEHLTLLPDHVKVYGYHHGVATSAPVAVSSGYRAAAYHARSNASWLHVHTGTSPGSLSWSVTPGGLTTGTHHGQITISAHGHSATLKVSYSVSPRAKLHVSNALLHFHEGALNSSGKPTIATCAGPMWDDEFFDELNDSSATLAPATTRQTLRISNTGPAGSRLHWQAFPAAQTGSWLNVELDRGKVATKPGRAIVATDGSLGGGKASGVRLISLANSNAIAGYPAMQQGSYVGTVKVYDLADPHIVRTVYATLTLGNGRETPIIRGYVKNPHLKVTRGGSTSFKVQLNDGSGGCGYAYSISSDRSWAVPSAADYSGTVPPMGSGKVGGTATGSGTGTIVVNVSAKRLSTGRHPFTLTVQSQNAEPNPYLIKLSLTVKP
ncbi:MAG TPA: S53 family peptidase [Mycobacteriales bacterium]|nr:S53 family peptidase [Mycobacteriales bacterium]